MSDIKALIRAKYQLLNDLDTPDDLFYTLIDIVKDYGNEEQYQQWLNDPEAFATAFYNVFTFMESLIKNEGAMNKDWKK